MLVSVVARAPRCSCTLQLNMPIFTMLLILKILYTIFQGCTLLLVISFLRKSTDLSKKTQKICYPQVEKCLKRQKFLRGTVGQYSMARPVLYLAGAHPCRRCYRRDTGIYCYCIILCTVCSTGYNGLLGLEYMMNHAWSMILYLYDT